MANKLYAGITMDENCKLKIPPGMNVTEAGIARIWIENDVLYSISKPTPRDMESLHEFFEALDRICGGKKVFMISETTEMRPYSLEEKEYFVDGMEKTCKGLAVITCKPLGRILPAAVLMSRQPSFPVKIFPDQPEAEKWIAGLKTA